MSIQEELSNEYKTNPNPNPKGNGTAISERARGRERIGERVCCVVSKLKPFSNRFERHCPEVRE